MSGFSRDWLALREPADQRARHDFGRHALASGGEIGRVLDLACGAGANFRYLAPRLAGQQHWTCIDHDRDLLQSFAVSLGAARPLQIPTSGPWRMDITDASQRASLKLLCRDLRNGIDDVELPQGALVAASALLDLVSQSWLESIVARCAERQTHVWFALTYDGRIECTPTDRFDARLTALVNEHQLHDKGFGPALGPKAATSAAVLLAAAGFRVEQARSDWRLDASAAPLQRALIDGWRSAAREIDDTAELERWHVRRVGEIDAGRLAISVGHVDLLASAHAAHG